MARIPPISRLSTEDFKEQSSWIGKLLLILNQFMSNVVIALNKGLTFSDNMNAQVKTLEFIQSTDIYPQKFTCTLTSKPTGLWIAKAENVAGTPEILSTAVFVDWGYGNGDVLINNISGLTNGNKYRISVIIIAG